MMSIAARRLRERIVLEGALPFARFMEEALYGEGGYYARPELPIGERGDFITGSAFSPLFGQATARLIGRLDATLGRAADVLEVGYGDARHLDALVQALPRSPTRRLLACERIERPVPAGVESLTDLERVRPASLEGLVFSYELFDAQPVHRLTVRADGRLGELWVTLGGDGGFRYQERELSSPELAELLGDRLATLSPGQIVDLSPAWRPLYRQLAARLRRGLLVTCDYGFERQALMDSRVRRHGTLACYHRQRVHRDALRSVGEQDLTAHVDFTTLREAGEAAGLLTVAFTRQVRWLLACGVFDHLQQADQATRLEAMTLLDPQGMGEEIRVLVQARDIDATEIFASELLPPPGASP